MTEKTMSYPSVDIIKLCLFIEITRRFLAVDHTALHWNSSRLDMLQELFRACIAHGIDAPF
jgi:hypothetical protein